MEKYWTGHDDEKAKANEKRREKCSYVKENNEGKEKQCMQRILDNGERKEKRNERKVLAHERKLVKNNGRNEKKYI